MKRSVIASMFLPCVKIKCYFAFLFQVLSVVSFLTCIVSYLLDEISVESLGLESRHDTTN